jgi:dTDP-glucose 4,6-dehydratase
VTHAVLKLTGKPESLIRHVTDRPGHDRRYAVDCSRAETELGWRPTVVFEQGLAETVDWYRTHTDWVARVRSGAYRG